MFKNIKSLIAPDNKLRLSWHKLKAMTAAIIYRFPADKLRVIGITGTNGKTTTVTLTTKILEKAGLKVGMTSTVGFKIDRKEWQNKTHKTTLGPFELQKLLRKMVKAGCEVVVIETSSHALSQHRVYGISYDIVAVTNVSPEHLDYHKSMKAYRIEKGKLFKNLMNGTKKSGIDKVAILNADDPDNFEYFVQFPADRKISYGLEPAPEGMTEHVTAEDIDLEPKHTTLKITTSKQTEQVRLHLPGEFNIENLLCASSIVHAMDRDLKYINEACKEVRLIPGRLESIDEGQDFTVYIDFAMTEDGYEKMLNAVRKTTENNIWVVFGCCGDRDHKKRPKIGEMCAELADKVIVCDDEPYTEDPNMIREMILEGLRNTKLQLGQDFWEIPDRAEAIAFACNHAKKGDTIVIPGMGDHEGRTFAEGIRPWNEREEVRKILRKMNQETV